ncbi:MAG: nucleotidyltransferase domain-containing protein [Candidatus Zixiibacteriota bacterium]
MTGLPNLGTFLPEMGTKTDEVTAALFPGTKRKLLALFFLNPGQQYYFSEVARLTATRQGGVQRELSTLTAAGILDVEMRGRQKFYSVNRKNPIFQDLRNIVFKTFGVVGQIKEVLEPFKKKIRVAFVYGSFAKGEETPGSDLDLFVIGSIRLDEIVSALSSVETAIGREINPTLFSQSEFRSKLAQKNHFLKSVLTTQMEFVTGTADELRRLAE